MFLSDDKSALFMMTKLLTSGVIAAILALIGVCQWVQEELHHRRVLREGITTQAVVWGAYTSGRYNDQPKLNVRFRHRDETQAVTLNVSEAMLSTPRMSQITIKYLPDDPLNPVVVDDGDPFVMKRWFCVLALLYGVGATWVGWRWRDHF